MSIRSMSSMQSIDQSRLWSRVQTQRLRRILEFLAISVFLGIALGLIMPRGPVTSGDALVMMAASLAAGLGLGYLLRTRWVYLLGPLISIVAFEIVRLPESGPTVDGLHLGTTFGILAFLTGRVVGYVLMFLPMATGILLGRSVVHWRTRWDGWSSISRALRVVGSAIPVIVVAALAFWIAQPASAPAVTGADGNPAPNGVAELTAVNIGGVDQWIEIRGADEELPVLLYLSGGPGQSDLALSRALLDELTADFLVVGWDQRGTGKSYTAFEPDVISPEVAVADTIDLTNYLRERFDEEKIYLMGESWGTLLGVLTIQERPDLYYAYIGSGQMVSPALTDQRIYEDLIDEAERTGDSGLVDQLREFGPPPYDDIWAYGVIMQHYELIEGDYDPPQSYEDRGEESGVGFWGIMGSEYAPIEKVNVIRGLIDFFSVMYPQLQDIDFRADAATLDVPVYLFDGEHELAGRRDLALEWFAMLEAPIKKIYTFENAGHAVAFEHADDLHRILLEEILPATYTASGAN